MAEYLAIAIIGTAVHKLTAVYDPAIVLHCIVCNLTFTVTTIIV